MEYMREVKQNSDIVTNVVQRCLWQNLIRMYPNNEIRIPITCYTDDYECNNPLGSHKRINKCGGFYVNIPVLPPNLREKVENILTFMLFNTNHRVKFSNQITFTKAIDELKFLKNNGITISVDNKEYRLYFDLIQLQGVNLGMNSILGLTESFVTNFFCRFCLTEHKKLHLIFNEHDCVLRDKINYATLLDKHNISVSGIKEHCAFNQVDDFNVVKNFIVDIQNHILKGILRYDLALLLHYFIYVAKFFSLDELNLRLSGYQYGADDNLNKP